MSEAMQSLIRLDGIKKVFLTDEVETHALSGIHESKVSPESGKL